MGSYFSNAGVDYAVIRLLPNTMLVLNLPFIQLMKENHGSLLFYAIDSNYMENFIHICALISSSKVEELKNFVNTFRDALIAKGHKIEIDEFKYFLKSLKLELANRN
jgi:hypothetical protein